MLEGAPDVLKNVNLLLTRTNDLLNDKNRTLIADILVDMATITAALAENRDTIQTLIGDAAETMENLKTASVAMEELAVALRGDAERLTDQAALTMASVESLTASTEAAVGDVSGDLSDLIEVLETAGLSLDGAAREMQSMISENREPLRDFSATGLYEFSALLTEARDLVRELSRVTTDLQRDPARFFFGDRQQGYETPQ